MADIAARIADAINAYGKLHFKDGAIAAERDFTEDTAAAIDEEVSDLVAVAYKRATSVLTNNRSVLDELAEMLVEKETVDAEDLQELLIRSNVQVAEYV